MNTSSDATANPPSITEGLTDIDGEQFYVIPDVGNMPPFLMSIVSDGDRWMFASSYNSLAAGRGDMNGSLFAYETDDRIAQRSPWSGPVTRLRVAGEVWAPFANTSPQPNTSRAIAKSVTGDAIEYRETHPRLPLEFRYRWSTSEPFGFVRFAELINHGDTSIDVDILDGLLGVMPADLPALTQQRVSNLANAYRRTELVDNSLAVFSLEAPVSDRAEPEEVLRANTAWHTGLEQATITIDPAAVTSFELGTAPPPTDLLTGRPGAFLVHTHLAVLPDAPTRWAIAADVARTHAQVADLAAARRDQKFGYDDLMGAERDNRQNLADVMALCDAEQHTGRDIACAHHVSNVTYNVMRGGVPLNGYDIDTADVIAFITNRNRAVARRHAAFLAQLPPSIGQTQLVNAVRDEADLDLIRLADEYLPFSFSRRHGDPSRPWNRFNIRVHDEQGNAIVYYEGNWRDVFQNWEALCLSFPRYLPNVIAMFVNASTPDGYNPYRISRDGIDWEVPDPDDPWANIGYWGDHQIVYLLRLLRSAERFEPGRIATMLTHASFTYANVPYRIAAYTDMVRNARDTITFDEPEAAAIDERVAEVGADGKLLHGPDGDLIRVTLVEKMLVSSLAKLSNFVPGGGIWMNTQRPEWNDANNALVGAGLSMVTLIHLRDYLQFFAGALSNLNEPVAISNPVVSWFQTVHRTLSGTAADGTMNDTTRRTLVDTLGAAATEYRAAVYGGALDGTTTDIAPDALIAGCNAAIEHLDATIATNWRDDGLAHSYNLIAFGTNDDGQPIATVTHLPLMLEGQVAALGSDALNPLQRADLLDALFDSPLYRDDQHSFLLAPVKRLPSFLERNIIAPDRLAAVPTLAAMVDVGETSLVVRDRDGHYRFRAELTTVETLDEALDGIDGRWVDDVARDRAQIIAVYAETFGHHHYLGRSGSMYAYEGIGSIYWHMVTKLLLAAQEAVFAARDHGAEAAVLGRLRDRYVQIRDGLGFTKTARDFGAVPLDPYSHTPSHAGAQQPGMTGAVKEELLARPAELAIRVIDGQLCFDPTLVDPNEPLATDSNWTARTLTGEATVAVEAGSFASTCCQVPIVVDTTADTAEVVVHHCDGTTTTIAGDRLDPTTSAEVFARAKTVSRIDVALPSTP